MFVISSFSTPTQEEKKRERKEFFILDLSIIIYLFIYFFGLDFFKCYNLTWSLTVKSFLFTDLSKLLENKKGGRYPQVINDFLPNNIYLAKGKGVMF